MSIRVENLPNNLYKDFFTPIISFICNKSEILNKYMFARSFTYIRTLRIVAIRWGKCLHLMALLNIFNLYKINFIILYLIMAINNNRLFVYGETRMLLIAKSDFLQIRPLMP